MRPNCETCGHSQADHLVPFNPVKGKRYRCTETDCGCQKFIAEEIVDRSQSTNDAIFVQLNKHRQYVAQWGSLSAKSLPNPDEASIMYSTLDEVYKYQTDEAAETEYGFKLNLRVPEPEPIHDEYHTMDELYEYRMLYHAHAVLLWTKLGYPVVKSFRHHDGEIIFDGQFFIVTAKLPTGQVSNHYAVEHWWLFDCESADIAPKWDGHTPAQVAERLSDFIREQHYHR